MYRAEIKSLYVVARNVCLALPGCCLAKHTKTVVEGQAMPPGVP